MVMVMFDFIKRIYAVHWIANDGHNNENNGKILHTINLAGTLAACQERAAEKREAVSLNNKLLQKFQEDQLRSHDLGCDFRLKTK